MTYKIIGDSCLDLTEELKKDPKFQMVPLTLQVGDAQVVDDETFDQKDFLKKVAACPECPKSACPSPERYMKAYECEADHIYAVTLSSELSGSYNSAVLGKSLFLEDNPGKKIHVFNSRSASGGESLIAMKIVECEEKGLSFEKIIETVDKYIEEMSTFFVLENLETLRKNGRLSRVKALVASALKIKPVMGSTPEGSICQLDQARGMNKAIVKMVEHVGEKGINIHEKTVAITHCNCPERAKMLEEAIRERLNPAKIVVMDTAGSSRNNTLGLFAQTMEALLWLSDLMTAEAFGLQFRKLSHFFLELLLSF